MQWLRWYAGTVSDPKFLVVARKSGQNVAAVIAVWAILLERALEDSRTQPNATERGMVDGFDCESSDAVLGLADGATQKIISALEEKEMLLNWKIVNWEKRQPKREDGSAERAKAWREKQKTNATERNRTQPNARGEERRVEENKDTKTYPTELCEFVDAFIGYVESNCGSMAPKGKNIRSQSLDTVEKLIRIDGFTLDQIRGVMQWAVRDDFWMKNAISLAQLRKPSKSNGLTKFQNIFAAMSKSERKHKSDSHWDENMRNGLQALAELEAEGRI